MELFQWPAQGTARLLCTDKWQETPDCVSFTLASPNPSQHFHFIPGQFVSLGVAFGGQMEYRAYSLSSEPNQPYLQFTVKRVRHGKVSNYLCDHLAVGDSLTALPPAGQFHLEQPHSDKLVLLSAGCGITPVMSMAKTLLADRHTRCDIHFIHAATCAEQLIYHAQLQQMALHHPHFKLDIMLEDATGTAYLQGRLTQAALANYCPDIAQRSAFLCGPVGFMQAMHENLKALGMDMARFYQESFTPTPIVAPEVSDAKIDSDRDSASQAQALSRATVFVPAFGSQTQVATGSVLLDALESANLPVIAACRSGICGSCKCRVTQGTFTRTSTQTLTQQELADGFVLACSCQITSDLEVALN